MCDEIEFDSEEEQAVGENNYIEVHALPLDRNNKPVQPDEIEEEKKEPVRQKVLKKKKTCISARESLRDQSIKQDDAAKGHLFKSIAPRQKESMLVEEDFKDEVQKENGFNTSNDRSAQPKEDEVQSNQTAVFCRFCWDYSNSIDDPLLSVCKCSGGVGYVHYICLKRWLQTKKTETRTQVTTIYYWKSFGCEICHHVYPYVFKANGQKYSLIDIPKPKYDYIILESLSLEKSTSRMVQVLIPFLRQHTFKLGRGLDQEVRISDISVSRNHAHIKYIDNKFILEDNLSKFGTLVLVRKELEIFPGMFR